MNRLARTSPISSYIPTTKGLASQVSFFGMGCTKVIVYNKTAGNPPEDSRNALISQAEMMKEWQYGRIVLISENWGKES